MPRSFFGPHDPWAVSRMRRLALIEVTERRIGEGVQAAMTAFLDLARAGVLGTTTPALVADAGDQEPPDLSGWPTAVEWDAFLTQYVLPPVSAAFGEAFAQEVRRGVLAAAPYRTAYLEEVFDRLRKWPEGAFTEIRYELLEGLDSGESIPQLRDRIGRVLNIDARSRAFLADARALEKIIDDPDASPSARAAARAQRAALFEEFDAENFRWWPDAERIARTETIGALNGGTYAGAQAWAAASGDEMFKQWWATNDNRVRPSHWAAHMKVVPLGEDFLVGGWSLSNPGDPNGPAHEVINCRCSLLILDAEEAADERARYERERPGRTDTQGREIDDTGAPLVAAATTGDEPMTAPTTTPALPSGWRGVLAPLGVRSGDDRLLAVPAELVTRDLPLPMLYQEALAGGHDGGVSGLMNITRAWIEDGKLWGSGTFELGDPRTLDVIRKIAGGFLRWVSVDLDMVMSELQCYRGPDAVDCDQHLDPTVADDDVDYVEVAAVGRWLRFGTQPRTRALTASVFDTMVMPVEVALEWRLMGATMVSQPAFQDAFIELVYDDAPADVEPTTAALPAEAFTVEGDDSLPLADRERPWDAAEADKRVAEWADGDPDKLGRAYFYADPDGDPATLAAYKLGYADVVDGVLTAIPRGLFAVAGVLEGAMGGADIPEADASAIRVEVGRWYDRMAAEFEDDTITPPWAPANERASAAVRARGGRLSPSDSTLAILGNGETELVIPTRGGARSAARLARLAHAPATPTPMRGDWDLGMLPGLFRPPAAWFVPFAFAGPTAVTITDDGRVYGHVGLYKGDDSCHIGYRGRCVPPPSNASYDRINNRSGSLRTEEGYDIACGKLVLGTTHASQSTRTTIEDAERHYADTGRQVARGRFTTDQWGPRFDGALMPGVSAEDVETLRSSALSGDWRDLNGVPHLIAALVVNTQGFAIPRATSGEDGRLLSLTAAGVMRPVADAAPTPVGVAEVSVSVTQMTPEAFAGAVLTEMSNRVRRAEAAGAMFVRVQTPRVEGLAARVRAHQADDLAQRVGFRG